MRRIPGPGLLCLAVCAALVVCPAFAAATANAAGAAPAAKSAGHTDPVAFVVLALAVILLVAKVGSDLASRIGQPAVLGELAIGVILGNLPLLGFRGIEALKTNPSIDMLAGLGVIILLFEVGLESTVGQMLKVGVSSFVVAALGVAAPTALGWMVGAWLMPDASVYSHAFLGATLCATSVGITARVLQDLNRSKSNTARVILGAAVIDDVMGLVLLAVVGGAIAAADRGAEQSMGAIAGIVLKATVFLVGALILGVRLSPKIFHFASGLQARGVLLATGLSFCFLLSWLASAVGLAPIVGAFAAGLVLENSHFEGFLRRGERSLGKDVQPISSFLTPVFFVLMGMHTDLGTFAEPGVVGLAAALTVAAIVGKQVCSAGAFGAGIDRLSVGIGMIPRGEVGLIFANIGRALSIEGERIISPATYSAVVVMVIVTTMVTPPALKWSLARGKDVS